jgi:hypothetical protein
MASSGYRYSQGSPQPWLVLSSSVTTLSHFQLECAQWILAGKLTGCLRCMLLSAPPKSTDELVDRRLQLEVRR